MRVEQMWDKWAVYDDDGFVCGISENAPEEVQKAYQKYIAEQDAMKKNGYMPK